MIVRARLSITAALLAMSACGTAASPVAKPRTSASPPPARVATTAPPTPTPPPTAAPTPVPTAPPTAVPRTTVAPTPTPCVIPQHGGGDGDSDNFGAPSDGDGCDR